jgi:hypothetical protein
MSGFGNGLRIVCMQALGVCSAVMGSGSCDDLLLFPRGEITDQSIEGGEDTDDVSRGGKMTLRKYLWAASLSTGSIVVVIRR